MFLCQVEGKSGSSPLPTHAGVLSACVSAVKRRDDLPRTSVSIQSIPGASGAAGEKTAFIQKAGAV
jgi:hypothetical protein